jgi:predicted Zn-dependent protease with MMP-like domain
MSDVRQWPDLRRIAGEEATRLVRELPKAIRPLVEALPILFEPRPSQALVEDGVEPDVMGLFVGPAFAGEDQDPIPAEIILFLENIRDEAEGDPIRYRQELRTTLLHEIGHYLGLNEAELWERELE